MAPLKLPSFEIPERKPKIPPPEVIQEWMLENLRWLRESGRYERVRQQVSRQPVNVRFAL